MMNRFLRVGLMLMACVSPGMLGQDGSDINQAIPVYFGQNVEDIMDSRTKPQIVFKVTLARNQQFSATLRVPDSRPTANLLISLWPPTTRSIANQGCNSGSPHLITDFRGGRSVSFDYQVATAGDYYLLACPWGGSTGVQFTLNVTARGTPISVPNPPSAGCLTGRVDSITYSLQLIAAGLADEASIGGQKICAASSCTVKPPLYPEIVNRLENALKAKVNGEACYDAGGNIFQIKLVQP